MSGQEKLFIHSSCISVMSQKNGSLLTISFCLFSSIFCKIRKGTLQLPTRPRQVCFSWIFYMVILYKIRRRTLQLPTRLGNVYKTGYKYKKHLPKQRSIDSNTNTKCSSWTSDLSRPALLLLLQNREVPSALDNSLRVRAKHPHYPTSPITKKKEQEKKTPIIKKKEEEK